MEHKMENKDAGWNLDNSYLNLPKKFFSEIKTNTIEKPEILIFNDSLGESLGLDREQLNSIEGAQIFAGNISPPGGILIAQAYAGHQFGNFTMLGDGRAVLIGEQITPEGERYDISLKGSGRTPYSRGGDGLAPLGPMLREYIISEAMHGLGIPTTRSLAVIKTGQRVVREEALEGAILTRVAKSHIRVGSFQYAAQFGSIEDVKALADYTINRHFPELKAKDNPYLALLEEVAESQAALIAKWQLVGFIHGVMNTDNMVISGETIDYGPCAFMNAYDPGTVFSSIDRNGRYAYGNQPGIGGWNIARFAESLLPLLHDDREKAVQVAEKILEGYGAFYKSNEIEGMRLKLGILNSEKEDEELVNQLFSLMYQYKADFTNTFVGLTVETYQSLDGSGLFESKDFKEWETRWKTRLERQDYSLEQSKDMMKKHNPALIARNHQVEKALKEATEKADYTAFNKLLKVLSTPYDYNCVDEGYMMGPAASNTAYRTFCGT